MSNFDIGKVRAKIVSRLPFMSEFITGIPAMEDDSLKTLSTDGEFVRYNPKFMAGNTPANQTMYYLHEVVHNFLGHPIRTIALANREKDEFDEETAQRAADYAVNDLIHDAGYDIPSIFLYSYKYVGMAFEEIYFQLKADKKSNKDNECRWRDTKNGTLQKQPKPGSDPHGTPEEREMTSEEVEKELKKQKRKMVAAANMGKMMGNLPANIQKKLDKLTESKVDWRHLLPMVLEQIIGFDDYSMLMPDPRYSDDEFMYPGMIGTAKPEIVIGFDTSGSITKKVAAEQCSEVLEIVNEYKPEKTHIVWCDSAVKSVQTFLQEDMDPQELKPTGGGGTNFRPVFEWAEQNDVVPKLLIYMTDGYCNMFPTDPGYPVVWVISGGNRKFNAPFGETIYRD